MPAIVRMPSFGLPIHRTTRRGLSSLLTLLVALVVALGATVASSTPANAQQTRAKRVAVARQIALHQVGDPYRYGSAGPRSFDCSGLIFYSYRRAGFGHVPRTSSAQAGHARRISKRALRAGDLMFFTSGYGVYHVGIFLKWRHGRAVMLHSPRPGQRVRVERSWTSSWFAGTLRAR